MLTKVRNRLAQEEGFTLIELLVVVLIIGILAAVAIPTFLSQKNKATDSNAQSNLKNAQTVVEAYADANGGTYPTQTTLGVLNGAPGLSTDSDTTALSSGSQAVMYQSSGGTADSYSLCAEGDTSNPTYWALVVSNGATTYGVNQGAASASAGCAAAFTAATSTSGFPAATN
jgi:type IV pilus assembly protein PilA